MSLNNIPLPPQLLADLYHHTLVENTATAMPQKPPVSFLGKAGKNILVVVDRVDVPYLPDSELAFLTKVLSACQLGLMDVAIINWNKAPHKDVAAIIEQFRASSIILFGIVPEQFHLPSNLPMYTVYPSGNRQFVAAPALQEIEPSKEAKGKLWAALKQMFCI